MQKKIPRNVRSSVGKFQYFRYFLTEYKKNKTRITVSQLKRIVYGLPCYLQENKSSNVNTIRFGLLHRTSKMKQKCHRKIKINLWHSLS